MCLSIVVLSCFSRRILKIRAIVIKRFELISDDEYLRAAASGNVGMQQRSGARAGGGYRQNPQDGNNIVITIPREVR